MSSRQTTQIGGNDNINSISVAKLYIFYLFTSKNLKKMELKKIIAAAENVKAAIKNQADKHLRLQGEQFDYSAENDVKVDLSDVFLFDVKNDEDNPNEAFRYISVGVNRENIPLGQLFRWLKKMGIDENNCDNYEQLSVSEDIMDGFRLVFSLDAERLFRLFDPEDTTK